MTDHMEKALARPQAEMHQAIQKAYYAGENAAFVRLTLLVQEAQAAGVDPLKVINGPIFALPTENFEHYKKAAQNVGVW
jgi:hypothetical protein